MNVTDLLCLSFCGSEVPKDPASKELKSSRLNSLSPSRCGGGLFRKEASEEEREEPEVMITKVKIEKLLFFHL